MRFTFSYPVLLLTILSLVHAGVHPGAQSLASTEAVRTLLSVLDGRGLNAVAAPDPTEPGTFVAALYIPGSQLLVVSARHPSVAAITHRIESGDYREVYLDLQGSPTPEGKFFVQDTGADGIVNATRDGGGVDVVYENGVTQTIVNGDFKAQRMTSAEYRAKVIEVEARYARLLTVLTAAARPSSNTAGRTPD